MQHIFEFIAVKKLNEEDESYNLDPNNLEKKYPDIINRYFNTQSSRKAKVTEEIYRKLKGEPFNISDPEKQLQSFLLRQLR